VLQDVQLVTLQATLFFSLFLFVNGLVLLWQGFTNGGAPSPPYRSTNETRVTFEHVMGVDGAKEELQELVHFLKVSLPTSVRGLMLIVYEALIYWCMRP